MQTTTKTKQRDLWASISGPMVWGWSYGDPHPDCRTVYTVYVALPGGRPRLQLAAPGVQAIAVTIDAPERFGQWHTPDLFAKWARRWKDAGDGES